MSERAWIHKYLRRIARAEGAGLLRDDVARLSLSSAPIATMDTLVEGTHFLSSDPLDTVGQKLVRVNVSDIYAKGALPKEALFSVAWPDNRGEDEFAALVSGLNADLKTFDIDLIGGDFVRTTGPIVLTLMLTGACLGDGPVRRIGPVEPGDKVFVTGVIGSSAIGLQAALNKGSPKRIERYRVPQLATGRQARFVAEHAKAAMDVSDGLLQDLQTLIEINGRGMDLDLSKVPLADPVGDLDGILAQVTGGDDYQILFVTSAELNMSDHMLRPHPEIMQEIGRLTAEPGLRLTHRGQRVNLPETLGFEH